jgi:hypothetical protein
MCNKIANIINAIEHPENYDGFDLINYINHIIGTYMTENRDFADKIFDLTESLPTTASMRWDEWKKLVNMTINRSQYAEIVKKQKIKD